MKTAAEEFLEEIETFLERSGTTATALGKRALKDPRFVFDIRRGRSPNLDLVQRVRDFIADHKVEP